MQDPVQYYHQSRNDYGTKYTLACFVPEKQAFLDLMQPDAPKEVPFLIGVARCSFDDQYVKVVGRNLAKERMSFVDAKLDSIDFLENGDLEFQFRVNDAKLPYWRLRFKVLKNSNRVHFLG